MQAVAGMPEQRLLKLPLNTIYLQVLLRAGCSRDARTKVDKTPLHVAAYEGHPDICRLLLKVSLPFYLFIDKKLSQIKGNFYLYLYYFIHQFTDLLLFTLF